MASNFVKLDFIKEVDLTKKTIKKRFGFQALKNG